MFFPFFEALTPVVDEFIEVVVVRHPAGDSDGRTDLDIKAEASGFCSSQHLDSMFSRGVDTRIPLR